MNWSDDYHAYGNKNCDGTSNRTSNSSWKKKEKLKFFFYFFLILTYPTKVITVWLENQWNCAKLCAYREFFQKVNHMMAVQLQEKKNGFFFIFFEFFSWNYHLDLRHLHRMVGGPGTHLGEREQCRGYRDRTAGVTFD